MTISSVYEQSNLQDNTNIARKMLNASASAATWFLTAVFGQWFFAYYIMIFYGGNAVQGNWAAWSSRMIHGIIEGDMIGNIAVFIHILLALLFRFVVLYSSFHKFGHDSLSFIGSMDAYISLLH